MDQQLRNFQELFDFIKKVGNKFKLVVCQANDPHVLTAVEYVRKEGLIEPILVGFRDEIEEAAASININLQNYTIEHTLKKSNIARNAVQLVARGEADILMKGNIQTGEILREVLIKDNNLNIGRILSTIVVFKHPRFDKLLYLSHAALNIVPDLKQKQDIVQNVINFVKNMGNQKPICAILSPVETVNPSIPETMDAACLSKMAERGTIKGGKVEGPLALDNALFLEAAERKGIRSPYAGQADILVAQDLASADVLYKSLTFLGDADAGCILIGARVPIVITSRADSVKTMINSIVLGIYSSYR
ncbi:MAG: bifunctional enoyl-CoA hydratase/phosphate acetyltransferase [Spirochaetales bacterium]|nr:bifunctional enoyl-CoA hydratase/phosphate acetyltransferase [Spirochaetales bacterium]